MRIALAVLIGIAGLPLVGFFLIVFFITMMVFPPSVTVAALLLMAVVVAWVIFGRSRGPVVAGSETALLGRQSSKDGLL